MKGTFKFILFFIPTVFMAAIFYLAMTDDRGAAEIFSFLSNHPDELASNAGTGDSGRQQGTINVAMNTRDTDGSSAMAELRPLYKWRNKDNTIVISTESPPAKTNVETFYFQTAAVEDNTVPPSTVADPGREAYSPDPSFTNNPFKVYTPSGLRELIDYSKAIGDKIELRGEELNALIEQMQEP